MINSSDDSKKDIDSNIKSSDDSKKDIDSNIKSSDDYKINSLDEYNNLSKKNDESTNLNKFLKRDSLENKILKEKNTIRDEIDENIKIANNAKNSLLEYYKKIDPLKADILANNDFYKMYYFLAEKTFSNSIPISSNVSPYLSSDPDVSIKNVPTPVDVLPVNIPTPVDVLPVNIPTPVDVLPVNMPTPVDVLPVNMPTPVNMSIPVAVLPIDVLTKNESTDFVLTKVDILTKNIPTQVNIPTSLIPSVIIKQTKNIKDFHINNQKTIVNIKSQTVNDKIPIINDQRNIINDQRNIINDQRNITNDQRNIINDCNIINDFNVTNVTNVTNKFSSDDEILSNKICKKFVDYLFDGNNDHELYINKYISENLKNNDDRKVLYQFNIDCSNQCLGIINNKEIYPDTYLNSVFLPNTTEHNKENALFRKYIYEKINNNNVHLTINKDTKRDMIYYIIFSKKIVNQKKNWLTVKCKS